MRRRIFILLLFPLILLIAVFLLAGKAFSQEPETTITLKSDSTWKVARNPGVGWATLSFDDSEWGYSIAPSRGLCGGKVDNFEGDPMWASEPKNYDTVYFRKKIILEDEPKNAFLKVGMDDDGEVFINGQSVLRSWDGIAGLSQGDVTTYLHKGENIIALIVYDAYGVCQSAAVFLDVKIPYANDYQLNVPLIKQSTTTWASLQYAGGLQDKLPCGIAIGDCGCVVSSLAMILTYHGATKSPDGFSTTPDVLNEYLSKNQVCSPHGCVSDGYAYGDVVWSAIHTYTKGAHDRFGTQKVMFTGGGAFDKTQVEDDIKHDKPVMLKAPNRSHWFVASGIKGSTFTLKDPLFDWSVLDNPEYKNTAAQIRRFTKVNSDFSALEIFVKEPANVLVTDPHGKKVGFDKTTHEVVNEIDGAFYFSEGEMAVPVHHLIIQTPEKGTYAIQTLSPLLENETEYVTYTTSRNAEIMREVVQEGVNDTRIVQYDPDFVSPTITPTPTLTIVPTATATPTPTLTPKPSIRVIPRPTMALTIDVLPFNKSNAIACKSIQRRIIPMVIMSSSRINAAAIDLTTVRINGSKLMKLGTHYITIPYDFNRDGRQDMIVFFTLSTQKKMCVEAKIILEGRTKDGAVVYGEDKISFLLF